MNPLARQKVVTHSPKNSTNFSQSWELQGVWGCGRGDHNVYLLYISLFLVIAQCSDWVEINLVAQNISLEIGW